MSVDLSVPWQVIEGDCLAVMPTLPEASVDAIVTDPPYGLEFMGKEWDRLGDVGKSSHGGFSDGTFKGFRLASYNASANVKCRACGSWKWDHEGRKCECAAPDFPNVKGMQALAMQEWHYAWAIEALRVAKPGAHLLAFGGTRTFHRLTCAIEDAGWEVRDCLSWLYGSGFPKSHNGPWGGTALKPAWEPIVMARKPLVGTVAANHAKHGTGALNVDGCRVGVDGGTRKGTHPNQPSVSAYGNGLNGACEIEPLNSGRWPANVVLDEAAARLLDEQSGETSATGNRSERSKARSVPGTSFLPANHLSTEYPGDSGGASRFFYTAKASRSEREAGLSGMERRREGQIASENGGGGGCKADAAKNPNHPRANTHPTVKPVKLMRWCIRLVTPPGGLVLDPFGGSGTTGVAAGEEGCRSLLIEREPEYVKISRARISHAHGSAKLPLGEPT